MTKPKIEQLGPGFNHGFSVNPGTAKKSKGATVRPDGELYKRPVPNPFTAEWLAGYADAMDGLGYTPPLDGAGPTNYRDGYETGKAELEALDSMGSSNA